MQQWNEILFSQMNNKDFDRIAFLNEYSNIIPGPNREAKNKRIKYFLNKIKKNKKLNLVQENQDIFNTEKQDLLINNNTSFVFGIVSDTHFNSKYSQITYLNRFYDICEKRGITDIYHSGDIDDGENMRPGHAYDNYKQGATDHVDEIVKNYPYREGITTHFITGNHDASFRKSCGLDIGKLIENRRKDLHYLGKDIATVNITNNISMMLRHPWDATAYAVSYKPQKMIEALRDTTIKPDILVIGHYHKMMYLNYLGIHCLQAGCFQGATPFTVGKGIRISLGGWIVTVNIDAEGKLESFVPEAVTFNEDIKDDYLNY